MEYARQQPYRYHKAMDGLVQQADGVRILIYCKAARREEAAKLLQKQAGVFGSELLALMFGHYDDLILKVEVA